MPCVLSIPLPKSGPFPRPALPGVFSRTDLSATLAIRPVPRGGSGRRVLAIGRASRVAASSIFHACQRQYPGGVNSVLSSLSSRVVGGLPLGFGGSAPALGISGPARRSLTFRPAWSLNRPRRPFYLSASNHVVASMIRSGCYQPKRQLLGGICTRLENAPFHGARNRRPYWR